MERRLQKDFQIGIVEGIVQAIIQSENEPKDVFSQIAKAIGRKGSSAGKKDWNAVVRQSNIAVDPIGSTNEAVQRQTRRSLRRHLRHQPDSDLTSMDPKRLVDYNPNLSDFTPATRIAYAKFILSKNKSVDDQAGGEYCLRFEINFKWLTFSFIIIHAQILLYVVSKGTSESSQGTSEEKGKTSRSSKVVIAECATDAVQRQSSIESTKKSLLKSTSACSLDKSSDKGLDIKATEIRSPSPIPEDIAGEEASKQSTSSAMSSQERKESKKENMQEQRREEHGEASDKDKSEEHKEEERLKDKDISQQSGSTQGNNSDNAETEILKSDKENDKVNNEEIPKSVSIQITKLQGKSKATGKIMGGWL